MTRDKRTLAQAVEAALNRGDEAAAHAAIDDHYKAEAEHNTQCLHAMRTIWFEMSQKAQLDFLDWARNQLKDDIMYEIRGRPLSGQPHRRDEVEIPSDPAGFGAWIWNERRRLGLSRADLARATGITETRLKLIGEGSVTATRRERDLIIEMLTRD